MAKAKEKETAKDIEEVNNQQQIVIIILILMCFVDSVNRRGVTTGRLQSR